jgi:carbon storage regulator
MLVLSRKCGQKVVIGRHVFITILEIRGDAVKLGFDAPGEVPIHREEVSRRIEEEQRTEPDRRAASESRFFSECA